MSTRSKRSPTLCRHKRTGHAYANFDGHQLWFGRYDDPETYERFGRTLAEWRANGCRLPVEKSDQALTLADVVARYLEFAERFYCRADGTPTREIDNIRDAVRPLLATYSTLAIESLGIRELKVVREQLIDRGLARTTIYDRLNRIVRIVGWAGEGELCKPEVFGGLKALRPLRRGRSRAKETKRVRPLSRKHVEAVLESVSRPVAGILELMWHTGMRPGEACQLRLTDQALGLSRSKSSFRLRHSTYGTSNT